MIIFSVSHASLDTHYGLGVDIWGIPIGNIEFILKVCQIPYLRKWMLANSLVVLCRGDHLQHRDSIYQDITPVPIPSNISSTGSTTKDLCLIGDHYCLVDFHGHFNHLQMHAHCWSLAVLGWRGHSSMHKP